MTRHAHPTTAEEHIAEMAKEIGERRARLIWRAAAEYHRGASEREGFCTAALIWLLFSDELANETPAERNGRWFVQRAIWEGYGSL